MGSGVPSKLACIHQAGRGKWHIIWASQAGESLVEEPKPQRRPFQFSLRKLMLWTAVWGLYLGVLRLVPMPLLAAVCLTVYLAILLPIRVRWGYARGLRIALAGTVLTLVGLAETCILVDHFTGRSPGNTADSQVVLSPAFFLGLLFAAVGFVFVHVLVVVVNWIDSLMETKANERETARKLGGGE